MPELKAAVSVMFYLVAIVLMLSHICYCFSSDDLEHFTPYIAVLVAGLAYLITH